MLSKNILDYLQNIKLMQLATCKDNKPWLCNVWYVIDGDQNIYWMSRKTRQHSQEIEQNPYVACTFHECYYKGFGEKGRALVVSGKAKVINSEDSKTAYKLYAQRYPHMKKVQSLVDTLSGSGHHSFYKLHIVKAKFFDELNNPDNPLTEIKYNS
jgi:uncharacterized protein YhbP (UPF0306 family)